MVRKPKNSPKKKKINYEYAKAIFDLNTELKKIKNVSYNEDGWEKYQKMRLEKEQELKFLIGSGKAEYFCLSSSQVICEDGSDLSLEHYLNFLPNIINLSIQPSDTHVLPMTLPLCEHKFNHKLNYFHIDNISYEINSKDFYNFVKQNAAPRSEIIIGYVRQFDNREFVSKFDDFSKSMIKHWKPIEEAPRIYVYQWGD